jgi:hypothetical protein
VIEIRRNAMVSVSNLLLSVVLSLAGAAGSEQRTTCFQAFPPQYVNRMQDRANSWKATTSTLHYGYLLSTNRLWLPGQTIRVAFEHAAASYQVMKNIALVAEEWSKHANIRLEFGHNAALQSFRTWSPSDTQFEAEIRIGFHQLGCWSMVGTDSSDPSVIQPTEASMNYQGFDVRLPRDWAAVVLHEFGHALGFLHEHQNPAGSCDQEFRWQDEAGYQATRDGDGNFIEDSQGRKPGLYTYFSFYGWDIPMADHNLKQIKPSHSTLTTGSYDNDSIMKYALPALIFLDPTTATCFKNSQNLQLSQGDKQGAARVYPNEWSEINTLLLNRMEQLRTIRRNIASDRPTQFDGQLRQLENAIESINVQNKIKEN